jgi:hypothetical protein
MKYELEEWEKCATKGCPYAHAVNIPLCLKCLRKKEQEEEAKKKKGERDGSR